MKHWSGSKHVNSFIPMPGDTARQEPPIPPDKPKHHIWETLAHPRCLHRAGKCARGLAGHLQPIKWQRETGQDTHYHSTQNDTRYLWFQQLSPNLCVDLVVSWIALSSTTSIASETLAFTHLHVGVLVQGQLLPQWHQQEADSNTERQGGFYK